MNEEQQKLLEFHIRENVKKELFAGYKKQIIAYVTAITFILGLFGIQVRSWMIQKAEEQVKNQVEATVKKLENRVQIAEKKLEAEIQKASQLETQLIGNMLVSLSKVAEQLGQADSKAQEMERQLDRLSQEAEARLTAFTNELDERSEEFVQKMAVLDQQNKEINSLIQQTRSGISLLEERIEKLEQDQKKGISSIPSEKPSLESAFNQGVELERRGEVSQAVLAYEQAMEQLPTTIRERLIERDIDAILLGIHQQDQDVQKIVPNLFNALAWGYIQQGQQPEQHLLLSQIAVALDPENVNYLDTLAASFAVTGDCERAVEIMEDVIAQSESQEYQKKLARYTECRQK